MTVLEHFQELQKIKDINKVKDYLMKSCSYIDLIDLIVTIMKRDNINEVEAITLNEYDFAKLEELFYKTFRVPMANGRGRKSQLERLSYEERLKHIANNPNLTTDVKEGRLRTAYLNEVKKNYDEGNYDVVVTVPVLANLIDPNYNWETFNTSPTKNEQ